jgi:type II secretory pathway pseudopilin PulG
LEILLVVGIIAILAGIVIIAINPSKQLATVRNTERKSDIKQIESAITQYYIDNFHYPTSLTSTLTEICDTGANASSSGQTTTCTNAGLINLSELVPVYLTAIPKDPSATTTDHAGYQIVLTSNKIGLSAPAELGQTITIGTVPTVAAGCGDPTNVDCWSPVVSDLAWGPYPSTTGVSTSTTLLNGAANTTILAGLGGGYDAAEYCANLPDGGYDWFLPSYAELWAGWGALGSGGFPSGLYWSSAEHSDYPDSYAWFLYPGGGYMFNGLKNGQHSVRCLR